MKPDANHNDILARKRWMGVLARAGSDRLEHAWSGLDHRPDYSFLRAPEVGMALVRGRAGGTGCRFNLGEMTMTRCTVLLVGGGVGHGYVAGRGKRHAELAAVFDALLQSGALRDRLLREVIAPLAREHSEQLRRKASKAAATKVNFFTMVRGEHD